MRIISRNGANMFNTNFDGLLSVLFVRTELTTRSPDEADHAQRIQNLIEVEQVRTEEKLRREILYKERR